MKRSFLFVLVLSLCFNSVSVSQQKVKYQHFVYFITPYFVSFTKDYERLGIAEKEAKEICSKNGRGEVSNSLVIPKLDAWNKVASEVESYSFSPSDRESLAQFVTDPLLNSSIDHFQEARSALSVSSSYSRKCSEKAREFDSYWSVSEQDKFKDDSQKAYQSLVLAINEDVYVLDNCNWLIAKYNLQYDKSFVNFDPIEIARQKGRTRPYHRK
jgi:hypothetical protein